MKDDKNIIATYFTSLRLKNFRGFSDVRLDLTTENGRLPQWTLLLGDNGVGKTTLLQSLAWMRPVLVESGGRAETDETKDIVAIEPLSEGRIGCAITSEDNDTLESFLRKGDAGDTLNLSATLCQGNEFGNVPCATGTQIETAITFYFQKGTLKDIPDENPKEKLLDIKEELGEFWEPFMVAYGANRAGFMKFVGDETIQDEIASNLSVQGTELHDAETELINLQSIVNEQRLERLESEEDARATDLETDEFQRLRTFKRVVASVLPYIADEEDIQIRAAQVSLRIGNVWVPFSELSLGYQTTLSWVLDLSWQLVGYYSSSQSPLHQPAIVLVDEIDLHLHPHWQWTIMGKLAKLFPRVQFIATSHSPIMVQSEPDANFAIVYEQEGKYVIENEPDRVKGWRVDQILNSEFFDFEHAWDPETEKLFDARAALLKNADRSPEDETKLVAIEKQISMLPTASRPEDQRAMDLIRRAAEILKDNPKVDDQSK